MNCLKKCVALLLASCIALTGADRVNASDADGYAVEAVGNAESYAVDVSEQEICEQNPPVQKESADVEDSSLTQEVSHQAVEDLSTPEQDTQAYVAPTLEAPAAGGWVKTDGLWYYYSAGKAVTGWQRINGKWYYFNGSGVMRTGWIRTGSKWYYLNDSGAMQTGWIRTGSKWYYLNDSGAMQTGWIRSGGKWYYLNDSGAMQTGWIRTGSKWYYLNDSGAMQTGWVHTGKYWYYMDASGAMCADGIRKINNKDYYLASDGHLLTGWIEDGSRRIYADTNGVLQTGWVSSERKWYYFESGYEMVKDTPYWIGEDRYQFDEDGVMITGWYAEHRFDETDWFYYGSDGAAYTGLHRIGNATYWFYDSGYMLSGGSRMVDGKIRVFDHNGKMVTSTGWYDVKYVYGKREVHSWYYLTNGAAVSGWKQIEGNWYFFDKENGAARMDGCYEVPSSNGYKGGYYLFDSNCVMISGTGWKYDSRPFTYGSGKVETRNRWYYLATDGSGRVLTKWQKIGGRWYYLAPQMLTGWQNIDGKYYFFDNNGVWQENQKGWKEVKATDALDGKAYPSTWYYFDATDSPHTGWLEQNKTKYYFDEEGRMLQGNYVLDGGKFYAFDANGSLITQTGWHNIGFMEDLWVYVINANGELKTGWLASSDNWYYLDPFMYHEAVVTVGDNSYGFDADGVMVKACWFQQANDSGRYYFESDGKGADGWKEINGVTYYFSRGYMYCDGSYYISEEEKEAVFDKNGAFLRFK